MTGLQGLASQIDLTADHPARVPVRLRHVPSTLALNSISGYRQDGIISTTLLFADFTQHRAGLDLEISAGGQSISSSSGTSGRRIAFRRLPGLLRRRLRRDVPRRPGRGVRGGLR
jgi:hypothetical protein